MTANNTTLVPHPIETRVLTVTGPDPDLSMEQRARVCEWLEANGINSKDVVAHKPVTVETRHYYRGPKRSWICFTQCLRQGDGTMIADERDNGLAPVQAERRIVQTVELSPDPLLAEQPIGPVCESPAVENLLRELHRRITHYQVQEFGFIPETRREVRGEITGLRGALGIVLDGTVRGGDADARAVDRYTRWKDTYPQEAATSVCACLACKTSKAPA